MLRKFLQPVTRSARLRTLPPGPPGPPGPPDPNPPLPPYNPESPDYVPPENIPGWTIPPGPVVVVTVPEGPGEYIKVSYDPAAGTVTGTGGGFGGGGSAAPGAGAVPPVFDPDGGPLTDGQSSWVTLWSTPGGRGEANDEPVNYMVPGWIEDEEQAAEWLYALQPGTYQYGFPDGGPPYMGWSSWDPVSNGNYPLIYGETNYVASSPGQRQSHFPSPGGTGVIGGVLGSYVTRKGPAPHVINPQCYETRYVAVWIDYLGNVTRQVLPAGAAAVTGITRVNAPFDPARSYTLQIFMFLKLRPECGGE
jgi:hypothetical protein